MKIRMVIFDFDGTLADSFHCMTRIMMEEAAKLGYRSVDSHSLAHFRQYGAGELIKRLQITFWKLPLIARRVRRSMASAVDEISLFQGVPEMLHLLHDRGLVLAMVTSNSYSNVRHIMGKDLAALFEYVECDAALFGKPARIRKILRRSGIDKNLSIFIGDEIRDLQAAHIVRIPFGAVSWGYNHADSLRLRSPDILFPDVDNMAGILSRWAEPPGSKEGSRLPVFSSRNGSA